MTRIQFHPGPKSNSDIDHSELNNLEYSTSGHTIDTDVDFDSHKAINVTDPTGDQDAATKKYVDDNALGAWTYRQTDWEYTQADFVEDNTWRDWDISDVVGENIAEVTLNGYVSNVGGSGAFTSYFRTNGETNNGSAFVICADEQFGTGEITLLTDSSGVLEYRMVRAPGNVLNMRITKYRVV